MSIQVTEEEQVLITQALDFEIESYKSKGVGSDAMSRLQAAREKIVGEFIFMPNYSPSLRNTIKSALLTMRKLEKVDLLHVHDIQLFLNLDELRKLALKVDPLGKVYNKFKTNKEKSLKLFLPLIEKLNSLRSTNHVCYSDSEDGQVYKFCLIGSDKRGFSYLSERVALDRDYEKCSPKSYLHKTNVEELKGIIVRRSEENKITEFEEQILQILNCSESKVG